MAASMIPPIDPSARGAGTGEDLMALSTVNARRYIERLRREHGVPRTLLYGTDAHHGTGAPITPRGDSDHAIDLYL